MLCLAFDFEAFLFVPVSLARCTLWDTSVCRKCACKMTDFSVPCILTSCVCELWSVSDHLSTYTVVCLSVRPSVYLPYGLSLRSFLYLPCGLSVRPTVCLLCGRSVRPSVYLPCGLCPSLCLPTLWSLSVRPSVYLPCGLSVRPSVYLPCGLSVRPSVYLPCGLSAPLSTYPVRLAERSDPRTARLLSVRFSPFPWSVPACPSVWFGHFLAAVQVASRCRCR